MQIVWNQYEFKSEVAINMLVSYKMLIDPEMELYKVSPLIIFDMWEAEKVTGDPRSSVYIRPE